MQDANHVLLVFKVTLIIKLHNVPRSDQCQAGCTANRMKAAAAAIQEKCI